MLSAVKSYSEVHMACGHPELNDFTYRGRRDLAGQKAEYKTWMCQECRKQVDEWVKGTYEEQPFPFDLPVMNGPVKAAGWAVDIRKAMFKKYGPLMTHLAKLDTDLSNNTFRGIALFFLMRNYAYWLDNRAHLEATWSRHVLHTDVGLLFKPTNGAGPSKISPYEILRAANPQVILALKEYHPLDGLNGTPFVSPHR